MKVVMEQYKALPCRLKTFAINDIQANQDDFGHMDDTLSWMAEPYSCERMCFHADNSKASECMKKYNITLDEFFEICSMLDEKLFIGSCGWCV